MAETLGVDWRLGTTVQSDGGGLVRGLVLAGKQTSRRAELARRIAI